MRDLYLDLMRKCLLNTIYADLEGNIHDRQIGGGGYPPAAHTMIGELRLRNLQQCCQRVIEDEVPGDFIEAGVWRGGATIMMRAVLAAYKERTRKVYVADSFQGLPKPDSRYQEDWDSDLWQKRELAISMTEVEQNFKKYDLLDDQVVFVKGWFKDTLHTLKTRFAVVRLDGDMYESTMQSLEALYPRLSVGGYVIVDDYNCFKSCKQAVHEYRGECGIKEKMEQIDWTGIYWRKEVVQAWAQRYSRGMSIAP